MKRIVIGGLPKPLGGVTTYLRRLLHRDSDQIARFLDFYPGVKEPVRDDCKGKIVALGSKLDLLQWLWLNRKEQRDREVFFNFSTPRALFLTLLAPKPSNSRWLLMLHHGNLSVNVSTLRPLIRVALKRFDGLLSLTASQTEFYQSLGCSLEDISSTTSYCEPVDHIDIPEATIQLNSIKQKHRHVLIMSGFPKSIYNMKLGIEAVLSLSRNDCAVCVFIYGQGELRDYISSAAEKYDWLYVFDGQAESFFNTFLRNCDCLMRLTEIDSFGISVWDADYWERKVIASNVCERPKDTLIVDLTTESVASAIEEVLATINKA